jgi:hypothetical protein
MDTKTLLYLEIEPYLMQWILHENGGISPVQFPKGSVENKILKVYLIKRPPKLSPDKASADKLAVVIPEFREKPSASYNYLPQRAVNVLHTALRSRFDIQLFNDLLSLGNLAKRQDQLIYAWMEAHGIDITETNWNAIAKRYQRQRKIYLNNLRQQKFRQNKKSE